MENIFQSLRRREECKNENPEFDGCERYVSEFTKTGIPVIIGLSLLLVATIVMAVVIRRQRRRQRAAESAKERMIDDTVELSWVPVPKNAKEAWSDGSQDHTTLPPEYTERKPARAHIKGNGRMYRDSDYV